MDSKEYQFSIKSTVKNLFRLLDDIDVLVPTEKCDETQLEIKKLVRKKLLDYSNEILKYTEDFLTIRS